MTEIPKAPIERLAKQEGAERMSKDAITAMTIAVEDFTKRLARIAIDLAGHADRKTVQDADVELAVKHYVN